MNSISKNQLTALLLITDIFSLFCCGGSISLATLWGIFAASAVQFLIIIIFALRGGRLKKWSKAFYLGYAVFCGGTLFSSLWRTSGAIFIPYENGNGIWGRLMTAGLIAIVCLYSSSTGIKSVARAAVIGAAAGFFFIGIDLVSDIFYGQWENATRPEEHSFLSELIRGFGLSGSLGSLAVLLGDVKGDKVRGVVTYSAAKAAASAAVIMMTLPVAGGIMDISDFPVITAAQLSQPFEAQRIDSLFLVVFAVFAVFSVTLQVMTGAYLLKELVPGFRRWRSTFIIGLTIIAAFIISGRELLHARACAAAAALIIAPLGAKISAAKSSG